MLRATFMPSHIFKIFVFSYEVRFSIHICRPYKSFESDRIYINYFHCHVVVFFQVFGTGTDPGFFLYGGAPLRKDVTDSELKKIKSEYVYTKKKAFISGGRGKCAPPAPPGPPLQQLYNN